MKTSFLSPAELQDIGFKSFGKNVLISRHATFYTPEKMVLGDNVRIDDFCLLTGEIIIGNFVHISAYTALYGKYGIELHDYSGLSARVTVISATDDFSGEFAVGPLLSSDITNVLGGKVIIGKYTQIGTGSSVLPGVQLNEGVAIGAMSLVNKEISPWKIAVGIPVKVIRDRKKELVKKINTNK